MKPLLTTLLLIAACNAATADDRNVLFTQADRLEYFADAESLVWDLQGWYGNPTQKFWWKLEGQNEPSDHFELQALYSRAVSPYFDAQFGLRLSDGDGAGDGDGDGDSGDEVSAVAGLQGTAIYRIEMDVAAFLGEDGEFEFRGELERDFRLTPRFVLQPRIEFNAASRAHESAAIELRLRYQVNRKLAPYAGISWQKIFDSSIADDSATSLVAGLRFWF